MKWLGNKEYNKDMGNGNRADGRKKHQKPRKKKNLFSLWMSVWIPLFLVAFVLVGIWFGEEYSSVCDQIEDSFMGNGEYLEATVNTVKLYEEDLEENKEQAEEYMLFTLSQRLNFLLSNNVYGVVYNEEGEIKMETSKSLYVGIRQYEDGTKKAKFRFYSCKDESIIEQMIDFKERFRKQYDSVSYEYKFDGIYLKGMDFIPAKLIVVKEEEETLVETIDFSLEGKALSDYEYIETSSMEGSQLIEINGDTDKDSRIWFQHTWDEAYLNHLKQMGFQEEEEGFFQGEGSFARREIQGYIKITVGDENYYVRLGKEYNPLAYMQRDIIFVVMAGLICTIVFALILSGNFYRIYKKELILQERQREFSNALAHDLKTPLMAISGYAENLAENIHTEKKMHYIKGIQSNIAYMNELVGQILDLAKIENSAIVLRKTEISLREMVQKVFVLYEVLAEEKHISMSMEGSGVILADEGLMERVVENLLKNAVEYTPENQHIHIKLDKTCLEITNSGVEIAKEKIEEMWKPFVKGDKSRSRNEGHGLGLSIVKNILDLHGFESEMLSRNGEVIVRIFFS